MGGLDLVLDDVSPRRLDDLVAIARPRRRPRPNEPMFRRLAHSLAGGGRRAGGRAREPAQVFASRKELPMPYDLRRFAVFVGGLMCLVLPASAAEAQTRPHRFEIAAGTMYGFQDPERPVTAGWIVSSGFDLGRQSFVVEGAWHRDAYALEHPWEFDEVFRERLQSRYWMLTGGVRGGKRQGRVAPYYQVLAGGFAARFRRDYEWPASCSRGWAWT